MSMNFGFSYIGLAFLLMLLIPNLCWTRCQPHNYDPSGEHKVLQYLERMGQILVSSIMLICTDFNIRLNSFWIVWLIFAFAFMVLYEVWWIRYFRSAHTCADFYRSILGIPVAGATLPIVAFFLLSIYGRNLYLMISVTILGIGHIGIHLQHRRDL